MKHERWHYASDAVGRFGPHAEGDDVAYPARAIDGLAVYQKAGLEVVPPPGPKSTLTIIQPR
ncbi:MAG: hypothetical protein ABI053_08700 [Lacisediminihabitans sp.]